MKKSAAPTPSFICKSYPAKKPGRVLFFFTAFGSKTWQYQPAYRSLNKLGYDIHSYQFQGRELLQVDEDFLLAVGDKVIADVHRKVAQHKSQGISEFSMFGVSMGSAFGIRCAKHTPEIKRMVLVTVYGNCAQEIWEYSLLKKMKKIYVDRGMSMQQVYDHYPEIEPTQNLHRLTDKSILLYASKGDKTIRIHNTQQLIDAAQQAGLNIETVIGTSPHVKFIVSTLLRGRRWREFLA